MLGNISYMSIWNTSEATLRQAASTQPALAAPAGDGAKAVAERTRVWMWWDLDDLIRAGLGDSSQWEGRSQGLQGLAVDFSAIYETVH